MYIVDFWYFFIIICLPKVAVNVYVHRDACMSVTDVHVHGDGRTSVADVHTSVADIDVHRDVHNTPTRHQLPCRFIQNVKSAIFSGFYQTVYYPNSRVAFTILLLV